MKIDRTADVLVVGAGPAGAAAAITASRAGRSTMIVDKAVFPRDKCCGDGLTTLALRELEALGLQPGSVAEWRDVDAAWLRSPSGREVRVPLVGRGQFAAIAPRLHLDHALVEHARDAGAELRDGCGITGAIDIANDHVDVEVTGIGGVRARYVIAADGMWSPVRRALGAREPGYLGEWHAFRQYAYSVTGPAADRLYVWFDADLLPGYAWSFPLPDGRVNLGFGMLRAPGRRTGDLAQRWSDIVERPHVRAALGANAQLEGRPTAWPIPARIDQMELTRSRVLFVGDAAAATDVLTGEGIGQALLTGRLAAEAILGAGATRPLRAGRDYERAVRHHLVADHRMSALLGRILAVERGARGAIKIIDYSGTWGQRQFARWMFEDEPRAIALTPRRWHPQMLRRDGAWAGDER